MPESPSNIPSVSPQTQVTPQSASTVMPVTPMPSPMPQVAVQPADAKRFSIIDFIKTNKTIALAIAIALVIAVVVVIALVGSDSSSELQGMIKQVENETQVLKSK
ncbi:hypothetical protein HYW82_03745 [Candidatus Peregrinibacteria bacterium]|nr:hypothetical protein [Candidatus Peregrinibacteria bacterium]